MSDKIYLCLSSSDSNRQSDNAWDFRVDLVRNLMLRGSWSVALLEVNHDSAAEEIYICADICRETQVHGRMIPLLGKTRSGSGKICTPLEININREDISEIHIYILDKHMREPSFSIEELSCTLVFTK